VAAAYQAAYAAGKPVPQCYLAAIDAVHRLDPAADRAAVASRVVRVLTGSVSLAELAKR
jgi:hypothetical protein